MYGARRAARGVQGMRQRGVGKGGGGHTQRGVQRAAQCTAPAALAVAWEHAAIACAARAGWAARTAASAGQLRQKREASGREHVLGSLKFALLVDVDCVCQTSECVLLSNLATRNGWEGGSSRTVTARRARAPGDLAPLLRCFAGRPARAARLGLGLQVTPRIPLPGGCGLDARPRDSDPPAPPPAFRGGGGVLERVLFFNRETMRMVVHAFCTASPSNALAWT